MRQVAKEETPETVLCEICERLRGLGVVEVEVSYYGGGDEGAINQVVFVPEGVQLPQDLDDRLEDWIFDCLPSGWEINEGSDGTVTIDVVAGTAHFDHGQNVVETVWESFEIGGEEE